MYSIARDDFRVMDALALSGGTIASTMNIYVIRELPLTELVKPEYDRGVGTAPTEEADGGASSTSTTPSLCVIGSRLL